MDRCALFVDAGYALADGAMAVHGTRRRDSVSWDHAGLLKLLAGLARDRTGLPVLRCYWYEAAAEGRRTAEHDALAEMPGLKLRLVNALPGRREGIESQLRRDLVTLAKSRAISDAFIASANEHIAEIVSEVQDLGLRVVILHISSDGGWTIPLPLRQECDDIVEISGVHLRSFVDLIKGAEPVTVDEQGNASHYGGRGLMDTNGPIAGALAQASPVAALPAPGVVYGVAGGGYRQDGAGFSPNGLGQGSSVAQSGGHVGSAGQPAASGQQDGPGQVLSQSPYPADGTGALAGSYLGAPAQSDQSQTGASAPHGQPGQDQSRAAAPGQGSSGQQPQYSAGLTPGQGRSADQAPYATAGYNAATPPSGEGQNGYRNGASQLAGSPNGAGADGSHRPSAGDYLNAAPYQSDGAAAYQNGGQAGYQNGSPGNGVPQGSGAPQSNGIQQGNGVPQGNGGQQGNASQHGNAGQHGNGGAQAPSGQRDGLQPEPGHHDSMPIGYGHNPGPNGSAQNGSGGPGQMPSATQNGAAQFGFAAGQSVMGQPANGQPGQASGQPSSAPGLGNAGQPQNLSGQGASPPGMPSHGLTGLNGNGAGNGQNNTGSGPIGAAHNGASHNGAGGHNGAGLALNGSTSNGMPQQGQLPGGFQPGAGQSMLGQPMPGQPMPGQPMPGQAVPSQVAPGQPGPGPQSSGHQGPGQGSNGQGDPRGGDPYSHGMPSGQQGQPPGFDPAPIPLQGQPVPGTHGQPPYAQGPHGPGPQGPGQHALALNGQSQNGFGQSDPGQNGYGQSGPGQNVFGQSGPGQNGSGQNGSGQNGFGPQELGYGQPSASADQALRAGFSQAPPGQMPPPQYQIPQQTGLAPLQGPGGQPGGQLQSMRPQPLAVALPDAVKAAHAEGFSFGESVGRDAPGLWLEAVLARKPRMPSDLEARLLQGSVLPIDSLLHDEVRHSLRRGFWDALESARR